MVFHSLFEEHIPDQRSVRQAVPYSSALDEMTIGPERYLNEIAAAKAAISIPIIASLNGSTLGGWIKYAKQIQQSRADALELNIYWVPTDLEVGPGEVESRCMEIVKHVKTVVSIPIAVKLGPFFSSFAYTANQLVQAGASGLVLFNRFYQPDMDLETGAISPNILLSTSMDMRLPLRWIGILYGRLQADLAATSGIHRGVDALKMVMAGADVTMLCSVFLRNGIDQIKVIEQEIRDWLESHGHDSLEKLKGTMSQIHCQDPTAFERAQYIRGLSTSWHTVG